MRTIVQNNIEKSIEHLIINLISRNTENSWRTLTENILNVNDIVVKLVGFNEEYWGIPILGQQSWEIAD